MTPREKLERMARAVNGDVEPDPLLEAMLDIQDALRELVEMEGYPEMAVDATAFFKSVLEILEVEL